MPGTRRRGAGRRPVGPRMDVKTCYGRLAASSLLCYGRLAASSLLCYGRLADMLWAPRGVFIVMLWAPRGHVVGASRRLHCYVMGASRACCGRLAASSLLCYGRLAGMLWAPRGRGFHAACAGGHERRVRATHRPAVYSSRGRGPSARGPGSAGRPEEAMAMTRASRCRVPKTGAYARGPGSDGRVAQP
jgi:hypothetical protein